MLCNKTSTGTCAPDGLKSFVYCTSVTIFVSDVTPFLLDWFHTQTNNQSLEVNVTLINANAKLAAQIAVAATKS